MKKVFFQMTVSIDGYLEGPQREIDWHIVDDELNAYIIELLTVTDVFIMGRRTYELMAAYWPTARDHDPVITERLNSTPKLAFSRTLERVDWQNSRLATGSIADEVAALKRVPGEGLLWVGGSDLASSFLEEGLLDELRIIHTPVLLGAGKAVFGAVARRHPLKLLWTKSFCSGNVVLAYRPAAR